MYLYLCKVYIKLDQPLKALEYYRKVRACVLGVYMYEVVVSGGKNRRKEEGKERD